MTRILLVDDSPVDRRLFSELLSQESDFQVDSCEDGAAALSAIADNPPDIVLTDMQMPVMDGLQLVQQIRERFAHIPVVLITGYGSEDLATKALRAGAAGYVPKSHSAELMAATIRHVLEIVGPTIEDERIHTLTNMIQYELQLENDETLIPSLLELAHQRIKECSNCDSVTRMQVEVALEQALLNAIYHGNLESGEPANQELDSNNRKQIADTLRSQSPYCDRRVSVAMRFTPSEARFVVKDAGNGFDVKEVSSLGLTHSLRGDFGQGLFLMWAFMDKVVFDKTGSSVTLIKRLEEVEEPELDFADKQPAPTPEETEEPKLVLRSTDGGKDYSLTKTRATMGRDASCDAIINSTAVSHHHCLLFLHEGWWFIRDLKSKNGIKINGKRHDSHLLPPASKLSIGPHEFQVEYEPHRLGGVGITPPVNPF